MAAVEKSPTGGRYTFRSKPCVANNNSGIQDNFRLNFDEAPAWHGNIMCDRRVVRGNTYASHNIPVEARDHPIELQRRQEAKRREIARRRALKQMRIGTPPPVMGRRHAIMQTEKVIDCVENVIEEKETGTQTEQMIDKPPSPLFVLVKIGLDKSTQIEDGDLFKFDAEVQPILNVMAVKLREQALIEVLEEEELAMLRQQQREFEEFRNADLIEEQRLEEQDRILREEKKRRIKQEKNNIRERKDTEDKVAARVFAKDYAELLLPSVMGDLKSRGFFNDPVWRDLSKGYLSNLINDVAGDINSRLSHVRGSYDIISKASEADRNQLNRSLLDIIVREVINERFDVERFGLKQEEIPKTIFQINIETASIDDVKSITRSEHETIAEKRLKIGNTAKGEGEEGGTYDEHRRSEHEKTKISFDIDEELLTKNSGKSGVFDGNPDQQTGEEYTKSYEEVHVYEDQQDYEEAMKQEDNFGTINEVPDEEEESREEEEGK